MHVIVHHNHESVDPLLGVNVYSNAYSTTCAIHTVSASKCKEAGQVMSLFSVTGHWYVCYVCA